MRANFLGLCATGVVLIVRASGASAQVYIDADVGTSLPQNFNIRVVGFEEPARFNPGIRGDLSVGYNFSQHFAAELQAAAIWNSVGDLNGQPVANIGSTDDIYQFPVLANLIYKTPVKKGFSGYLGVGAGGVATIFDATGYHARESDSDFTFAYQGMAGVKYQVAPNVDVGIGYKFLGSLDHHWTIQGRDISSTSLYTHSITATFTFRL